MLCKFVLWFWNLIKVKKLKSQNSVPYVLIFKNVGEKNRNKQGGKVIPFPVWVIPFPVLKINFKILGTKKNDFVKEVISSDAWKLEK